MCVCACIHICRCVQVVVCEHVISLEDEHTNTHRVSILIHRGDGLMSSLSSTAALGRAVAAELLPDGSEALELLHPARRALEQLQAFGVNQKIRSAELGLRI